MAFQIKDNWIAVVIALLLAALIALGYFYWELRGRHGELVEEHGLKIASLKQEYEREAEILRETANKLKEKIEESPAVVDVGITAIRQSYPIRVEESRLPEEAPEPVTVPASCIECFGQVEFPYRFANEFVELNDVIVWDDEAGKLGSDAARRSFTLTPEFTEALVEIGLLETDKYDTQLFRARWFVGADAGYLSEAQDFSAVGVAGGAEFMNLRTLLDINMGVNVKLAVVPQQISQSHLGAGVDWRPFRNVMVGVSYGRSFSDNLILLDLGIFAFD